MSEKLLISTHCDLDAIGVVVLTRFIADTLNEKFEDYELWFSDYMDYDNNIYPYERLKEFKTVWYFDFTPNNKARDIIQETGITCIIGDHHEGIKAEIDSWEYDKKTYIFNNDQSGAKIYYNFLLENKLLTTTPVITDFIERVSTYDLYQKTSPIWIDAQNLNRLLYKTVTWSKEGLSRYDFFINRILLKFKNNKTFTFDRFEQTKIDEDIAREDELFNEFVSGKREIKTRKDRQGRWFAIISLNSKISIICSRLLEKYPKLDYIIAVNTYNQDANKMSVRSTKINLVEEFKDLAGHAFAAAHSSDTTNTHTFCQQLLEKKIWCLEKK